MVPPSRSAPSPRLPAYGSGTLAEVLPSALALIDEDLPDPLGLREGVGPAQRVCVLLADGLGCEIVDHHRDVAPTLASMRSARGSRRIDSCFPSTTATSLVSLGTGTAPGRHGFVGYTAWMREVGAVVNLIRFNRYGETKANTLVRDLVPEQVQPNRTVFEHARDAGIATALVSDRRFANSGLTRAALRGPQYVAWDTPDEIPTLAAAALADAERTLVFAYDPRFDHAAHGGGIDSDGAVAALAEVDRVVARLGGSLPPGSVLLVTGDHGMVDVGSGRVDVDDDVDLAAGVRALGGEPRVRHVYTREGAADDVLAAWTARLGDVAWVRSGTEAAAAGWFGPHVGPEARGRIGDVIAAYHSEGGVFCKRVDPRQATLVGHHGSLTEAETAVPLLLARS